MASASRDGDPAVESSPRGFGNLSTDAFCWGMGCLFQSIGRLVRFANIAGYRVCHRIYSRDRSHLVLYRWMFGSKNSARMRCNASSSLERHHSIGSLALAFDRMVRHDAFLYGDSIGLAPLGVGMAFQYSLDRDLGSRPTDAARCRGVIGHWMVHSHYTDGISSFRCGCGH